MSSWKSRGTYVIHTWRTIKVLKFLFVLEIVTELRFWNFEVYFRTFTFKIFSTPKLSVRRCRAIQAVGIFRHLWPNDIFGNSGFYIHGFVYSGLKLSCLPYSADLFWWFLLWQPPKWEVWNKHSWAEGSKALNFQNPEYPKKEKESPQPWISATGSWWSIIFQFNISGKFSQNLWPIQISVWFHHFNYKSKLEMSVMFSFVVL